MKALAHMSRQVARVDELERDHRRAKFLGVPAPGGRTPHPVARAQRNCAQVRAGAPWSRAGAGGDRRPRMEARALPPASFQSRLVRPQFARRSACRPSRPPGRSNAFRLRTASDTGQRPTDRSCRPGAPWQRRARFSPALSRQRWRCLRGIRLGLAPHHAGSVPAVRAYRAALLSATTQSSSNSRLAALSAVWPVGSNIGATSQRSAPTRCRPRRLCNITWASRIE